MRKLTIILRTCAKVFALHGSRYVNATKIEIINKCLSSLVVSINNVKNHEIELFVIDDHSDEQAVTYIKNILEKCNVKSTFISVNDGTGPSHTCKKVYEIVDKHATDLWYHVEDDYLHYPTAIQDMIDSVIEFEENTGKMVAINPHDDIWRYTRQIYYSLILLGPYRHYRSVNHTTYTCLASKEIFKKYKKYFDDAATWILRKSEDETINKVWNMDDVILFSPIPSLALHLMDESGKDPYINFDDFWNSIPVLWN